MKKPLLLFLLIAACLCFLLAFRPHADQGAVNPGGGKILVMEASWKPGFPSQASHGPQRNLIQFSDELESEPDAPAENVSPESASCLFCHGFTYTNLRTQTENYEYQGSTLQPHEYLDMTQTNPHATTKVMECVLCHTQHELPAPVSVVSRPNLDYCINCHHTGEIIHCSECHGENY